VYSYGSFDCVVGITMAPFLTTYVWKDNERIEPLEGGEAYYPVPVERPFNSEVWFKLQHPGIPDMLDMHREKLQYQCAKDGTDGFTGMFLASWNDACGKFIEEWLVTYSDDRTEAREHLTVMNQAGTVCLAFFQDKRNGVPYIKPHLKLCEDLEDHIRAQKEMEAKGRNPQDWGMRHWYETVKLPDGRYCASADQNCEMCCLQALK
jgi:hypothetical protein